MTFQLMPIISLMLDFYQKNRDFDRFKTYLGLLQGETKSDMVLPISGFNPMAKEHIVDKLIELQMLGAEQIMQKVLTNFNEKQANTALESSIFNVALCLSDDLKGGWTNQFTTDFDSKFKLNALIQRNFCTPMFWTSESYNETLIKQRTEAYLYRTIYWLSHPKPKTLKDHIEQEQYVSQQMNISGKLPEIQQKKLHDFYQKNCNSDNYALIFNFFYGDKASKSLGFTCFGIREE